ncbi:MAG: hypothetical protein GY760_18300 [Deltaproteobacteria bacterium]|nr:hypothetical protein [Deltaproteobacteria bacterium]
MKAIKKAIITLTGFAVLFFGANTVSAETFVQSYYKSNPVSVKALESEWGKPLSVKIIGDDIEKRVYGKKDVEVGYNYFIVKAGVVTDRGVTQSLSKKPDEVYKHKFSGWMPEYYKSTKKTVSDIISEYEEPIYSKTYANGMEKFVFGPIEQDTFAYIISLNGRVLDAGTIENFHVHKAEKKELKVSPFMSSWYKKHPKSVAFITKKWGKPLSVKKYKNGLKKMVFGPKDAEMGYQFFITKDGQVVDRGVTESKS